MSYKTHIIIPSVEGQLGFPSDLIKQYKHATDQGQQMSDDRIPTIIDKIVSIIILLIIIVIAWLIVAAILIGLINLIGALT